MEILTSSDSHYVLWVDSTKLLYIIPPLFVSGLLFHGDGRNR